MGCNKKGFKQKDLFLNSEGDCWFDRNKSKLEEYQLGVDDPVIEALLVLDTEISSVLEIGCANGWRLLRIHEMFGASCCGIDPSLHATNQSVKTGIELQQGTADSLPYVNGQFDVVIAGFCLYLCDRSDLFQIAAQMDKVLTDGGHMVVYDFYAAIPYKNSYGHLDGLYSYKMDYSSMFSWNPAYQRVYHRSLSHDRSQSSIQPDDHIAVTILRKDLCNAYPDNPF